MDVKRIEVHKFMTYNCQSQQEKWITRRISYTNLANQEKLIAESMFYAAKEWKLHFYEIIFGQSMYAASLSKNIMFV